ncbi:Uncharacterised protein [Escherichia coli]|nr:Uncharacterised protein [Escherichia coli]
MTRKRDAEVKAATIELQSKLITLQAECFSLGDAIRAKEDEAALLRSKLAVLEDFKKATQEYSILKTPGGTLVYSALIDGSNDQFAINACPRCFQQSQLSILQPSPTTHSMGGYFIHYCPLCKSEFKMDKVPPMPASFRCHVDLDDLSKNVLVISRLLKSEASIRALFCFLRIIRLFICHRRLLRGVLPVRC